MTDRLCAIEGCGKKYKADGLCNTHYERQRLGLDLAPPIRQYETGERLCKADGCDKPRACSADLCGMHYQRLRKRLNRYGLTHEAFLQLLADQGDRCAICKTAEPSGVGWCVDHDHVTGRVRGVLCDWCNQGIGRLRDDPFIVAAALHYLTKELSVGDFDHLEGHDPAAEEEALKPDKKEKAEPKGEPLSAFEKPQTPSTGAKPGGDKK